MRINAPVFSGTNSSAGTVELSQTTGATTPDHIGGSLPLTGGDPPDAAPVVTLISAVWSGGGNIPAALVANAEAIVQASVPHDTLQNALKATLNGTSVAINFNLPDKDVDFLALGETLQLTYSVTVHNAGGDAVEPVIVTITGTNDLPVISIGQGNSAAASITERANLTGQPTADTASGTLHFVDVDLTDTHTVAVAVSTATPPHWSAGNAIPPQTLTDIQHALTSSIASGHDSTGTQTGTINWKFSLPDKDFDFLAVGETLKLTYDITLTDSSLGTSTKSVTITVHGSEDAPTITSAAQAATITEDTDLATGENTDVHSASGTVTFNDVDLSDLEASSITNTAVSPTLANGYTLTTDAARRAGQRLLDRPGEPRHGQRRRLDRLDLFDLRRRARLPRRQRRGDADLHGAGRRPQWRHHQPERHHHGQRHRGRADPDLGGRRPRPSPRMPTGRPARTPRPTRCRAR